ncbi:MAG: DksA family protein [Rhodanobacteraceae bacterium]|jgi:DnaK suppressor protein|nr:MAG: DksA family protein [Rhodanobacteraceae bacterium]
MAKPKRSAAKQGGKKAKPAAKPAKARPARKTAAKPARKAAAKTARKAPAKAVRKPVKAAKTGTRGTAKTAKKQTIRKVGKTPPVKKSAPKTTKKAAAATRKPDAKPAPASHAPSAPATQAGHGAPHPPPSRKPAHVRPAGGVAARLSTVTADEQTITREDGRYALPASVNVELPKGYKPSPQEEYMNPKHLAYFRQKLKDWRDQLVEESRQTMENLREEVRDVGDDAERATRETENSLELRTRDRYRKLISKIEKALRKIEEGRYGYCEETDEEIGLERLEARPIATLSLDAQERREHLQKQMGD